MSQVKGEDENGSKQDSHSETSSQRNANEINTFELEGKISSKIICLRTTNAEVFEGTMMVQHNEAVLYVRKQIIEKAKNFWKEAIAMNTN